MWWLCVQAGLDDKLVKSAARWEELQCGYLYNYLLYNSLVSKKDQLQNISNPVEQKCIVLLVEIVSRDWAAVHKGLVVTKEGLLGLTKGLGQ